jgi:hypothetical protein
LLAHIAVGCGETRDGFTAATGIVMRIDGG